METYVCLLIDEERRIVGVDAFIAEDDAAARAKASAARSASPTARTFELWHKGRKIAVG